jgi:glycosyltransferase involved in cell wall biosynthesis
MNINPDMIMTDRPSIGIIMNTLDMGGAEKQSLLQAKLMGDEFDVHYIVQKSKPRLKQHVDFIGKENIKYIQLSGNMVSRIVQLSSYIKRNRIKVIFAYLTSDNFLASAVSIFNRIKTVGGVRSSSLPVWKFYITLILQKYFLDYTIFNNHFGRDLFIKRGFSIPKSIVIQNCINNIQPEIVRTEKKPVVILSVGRFTAQKDYLTALKAIQLVSLKTEIEVKYVIVGDGELYQQLRDWISFLKLTNVEIVRNPENIGRYYTEADIYFLSSNSEGLPNTIMEALNYSLPVVTTNVGDSGYLVKEGVNGHIAQSGDFEKLAEKLSELVCRYETRIAFGTNGHDLLIRDFSEKKFQEEYIKFTRSLI